MVIYSSIRPSIKIRKERRINGDSWRLIDEETFNGLNKSFRKNFLASALEINRSGWKNNAKNYGKENGIWEKIEECIKCFNWKGIKGWEAKG